MFWMVYKLGFLTTYYAWDGPPSGDFGSFEKFPHKLKNFGARMDEAIPKGSMVIYGLFTYKIGEFATCHTLSVSVYSAMNIWIYHQICHLQTVTDKVLAMGNMSNEKRGTNQLFLKILGRGLNSDYVLFLVREILPYKNIYLGPFFAVLSNPRMSWVVSGIDCVCL